MNTFKSFRYLSVVVLLGTWGCSQKQVATKGDYDDLYGSSKDAPQVTYRTSSQPSTTYQNPDYTDNLRYQREELPAQTEGTDEYFDENYVNSRKVQRTYTSEPGYSSGFSDGYQSGWNDYAWSQPMGWASPFSRFGYYSPFGYNSFGGYGSGFGLGLSLGYGLGYGSGFGYGGFGNRFYDPFWGGGMYSPYYSSFYSPWGNPYYNSFYSPYDYYGYGYGRYGGFGYPGYLYNVTSGVDGLAKTRTYGPRDGGRGSAYYNDRFNNTAIGNSSGGRRADANARTYSGSNGATGRSYSGNDGYYAAPRRNGADNSSFNNTPNSSRANSSGNDTYYARPRRNGGYESGNSSGNSTRTYDYSRPSNSRSSSGNSWSNGSGNSRSSDSWSRGSSSNSNNSSWSSPSRSSSSSSGGSVGGGSRGGSSGGGGGSRGPR
ncbi:hypothetical protein [Emticicia sp. C21]|uniref:hypothetical protein n=1 Tax=Emticicia sp. C21 TaxID=2302915 RepID=UPI00131428B5|nr:hypothetical protein [Emticicia sp. C21]